MTSEEILAQLAAGYEEELEVPEEFEVVHEGEWTQLHKDQICEVYVRHRGSGKHFCIRLNRRGAYWSYYDYGDPDFFEVERREETKVVVT